MGEGAVVERKNRRHVKISRSATPLLPHFWPNKKNFFRILSIFVRNDPTFRLVGPIWIHPGPSLQLSRHFPLMRKVVTQKFEIWNRLDYYGPDLNHRFMVATTPPIRQKKNPARSRGLVQTRTWPPVLAILLSEPGSELASAQQAILSVRPPTSGTKITQICLILPKTFMGIIPGPTFGETSVNLEPDLSPRAH